MELFKLFGTIAVNNSDANEAIDETSEKAGSFGEKLKSGISTAAKWGTAIVGGATAAGAALVKFAESSASTADNVDKMSQKIGISREAYQELDFICSQSGTSVDNLQAGMKSLVSAMDGAASGTASNIEQFEKLGVSVIDANGNLRNSEDVMWETMAALQNMDNQTEKARLATELFGRSGTELMPLLNGASGSINEMRQQAHDLGLVLSDELINNGVNLTDSLDQTKRAFQSIVTQLGAALMPILEKVSDYIQTALPTIQELIERLSPILTQLFENLLPPLMNLCESLLPVIFNLLETLIPVLTSIFETVLPIIVDLLNMILPPLVEIIQILLPPLMEIIQALMPVLQTIIDLLAPIIELVMNLITPIINLVMQAITPLVEIFVNLINTILQPIIPLITTLGEIIGATLTPIFNALSPVIENVFLALSPLMESFSTFMNSILQPIMPIISKVAEILGGVLGSAFKALMPIIDGVMDVFGGLIDFITGVFSGNWDKAWNGIVSVFKGIFNLIPTIVESIINGAISIINGIINGINTVTGLIGIPKIPEIPKVSLPRFAEGGVVEEETTAVIGENGAEAVVPLENNTGWIQQVAKQMASYNANNEFAKNVILLDDIREMYVDEKREISRMGDLLERMLDFLIQYFPEFAALMEKDVVLDDGTLVAKLTPKIDRQLAVIYKRKDRG